MRDVAVLNPGATDYDAFVEHLAVEHRASRARWHLQLSGAGAVPALRRGVHHPDPRVRRDCVMILDHLMDEAALDDVIQALDDDDPEVVARALHTLACDRCKDGACRPGEQSFVPKAIDIVGADPRPEVRLAAVDALGKVVHRRSDAHAALEAAAAADGERAVRKAARLRLPGGAIYERTRPAAVRRQRPAAGRAEP